MSARLVAKHLNENSFYSTTKSRWLPITKHLNSIKNALYKKTWIVTNVQVIKEITDGGADYCFECIGLASVMEDAFNSNREVLINLNVK